MITIKGQDKITKQFDSFTVTTLPHTFLLCGEEGCGKHTLLNNLSEKLQLPLQEITPKESTFEYLCQLQLNPLPMIYVINIDKFKDLQQNNILKFIEEPPQCAFCAILCSSQNGVLDTVKGRSQIYSFSPYSDETLREFTDDDDVLKYCRTPGQIQNSVGYLKSLKQLCININYNISTAAIGNILSIVDKIPNPYPADVFVKVLMNTVTDSDSYKLLLQASKDLKLNQDKKWYLESLLIQLKFVKKKHDITIDQI